jgi:Ca2+:H+ antiporter
MGGPQRSATLPLQDTRTREIDVENGGPLRREGFFAEDETPLSPRPTFQSDPSPRSRGYSEQDKDTIGRHSKDEFEMTPPVMSNLDGKSREGDSEETTVDRAPTRPRSEEEKARRRFLARFRKPTDKDEISGREGDDTPKTKKQPWYKGKVLKHKPFTVANQLRATILSSWVNILLLAAPVGIALNYAHVDGKIVFVVNFIAIIPLAGMLSFATEEISLHVGESLGGLLNASFGYVLNKFVAELRNH